MIPDITTGQRTYFLGLSSTLSSFDIDIPFRDTAGNIINCNYVKIENTVNAGNGTFVAELSGLSRVGNMTLNNLRAGYAVTTTGQTLTFSGILGIGGAIGQGANPVAVWHGSNGEVCNGLKLRVAFGFGGSQYFGITYGNLLPFNITRITGFSNVGQYPYPTEYNKGV